MLPQYAGYAIAGALGLFVGLMLGLLIGWLWHRATISRLRGQRDLLVHQQNATATTMIAELSRVVRTMRRMKS